MNKLIIVIVLIETVRFCNPTRNKTFLTVKETKLFHVFIQNTFEKIFNMLRLNQNFTSTPKHRTLLTLYAAMKKRSIKNCKTQRNITNFLNLDSKNETKDRLKNIDKLVDILTKKYLMPKKLKSISEKANKTQGNHTQNFLEIKNSSQREKINDSINKFVGEHQITSSEIKKPPRQENFNFLGGITLESLLDNSSVPVKNVKRVTLKYINMTNFIKKWEESLNFNDSRRVFDGASASIYSYPFVASIHVMREFVCGGTIIQVGRVITAATCVQVAYHNEGFLRNNRGGISVRVGSPIANSYGELHFIHKIFFHPSFNPVTLRHNLAILVFESGVHFRQINKLIQWIDYTHVFGSIRKEYVVLLGWGEKHAPSSPSSGRLSVSKLNVFDLASCKYIYSPKYVTDTNFCTGYRERGSGACQHDIGGPAIYNSTLVGVVSFGPPVCGTPDAPTVFTDLGYYFRWIDRHCQTQRSQQKPKRIKSTILSLPTGWGQLYGARNVLRSRPRNKQRLNYWRCPFNNDPHITRRQIPRRPKLNFNESTSYDKNLEKDSNGLLVDITKLAETYFNKQKNQPISKQLLIKLLNCWRYPFNDDNELHITRRQLTNRTNFNESAPYEKDLEMDSDGFLGDVLKLAETYFNKQKKKFVKRFTTPKLNETYAN